MVDAAGLLEQVVAAVRGRTPVDDRERVSIERFVTEVAALAEPFAEDASPTHVTASALVVGRRGIVLHRHRVLGIWIQPGGHIDAGETPWDAALREAVEETGLAVRHAGAVPELAHVDVHPGPRGHTHLDLRYLLDGGDADPAPPPEESQEVAWFDWPAALDHRRAGHGRHPALPRRAFVVTSADMDIVELHARTVAEFVARAAAVDAGQWGAPTPCTDWDVRQLVNHVVGEDRWTGPLLAGQTIAEVGDRFDGDLLGDDPVATVHDATGAALASVAERAPPAVRCTCRTATRTSRSTSGSCRPTT